VRPTGSPRRRSRHPARRARRAVGVVSVAGFAAIGGAVAIGTGATASSTITPTAPTESSPDQTAPSQTAPNQTPSSTYDDRGPSWRRDERSSGPVAVSSGSLSPDTSSHGS